MHQRVRGMTNARMNPIMYPLFSDKLIGKLSDLKIELWDMTLSELGDVVDIVAELDDYGTQSSLIFGPDQFRTYYKPQVKCV